MRKEMFDTLEKSGIFEMYNVKIENTTSKEDIGVFVEKDNDTREKVTLENFEKYFDIKLDK